MSPETCKSILEKLPAHRYLGNRFVNMKTQILLLANSKKPGGRCLAGIRLDTLEWVRPITLAPHNSIPTEASLKAQSKNPLRPLDVIEVDLIEPKPFKYQRENWVCDPGTITEVGNLELEKALIQISSKIESRPWFLQDGKSRIDPEDYIRYKTNAPSLALIEVASAEISHNRAGSRRIVFEVGKSKWDLPFTDDNYIGEDGEISRTLLCLSVGEEWQPRWEPTNQSWHYKLVAALIELPTINESRDSELSADSLVSICERRFGFIPVIPLDRQQSMRFSSDGWFYQGDSISKCSKCGNEGVEVIRKHFKKFAREMHYWGILCPACKTAVDSKEFDKSTIRDLNDRLEKVHPVNQICPTCISSFKNF